MKIYFDGGCRPNPGTMEVAVVARGALTYLPGLGQGSSEQAEWLALLHALDVAQSLGMRDLLLLGDAVGVINQATCGSRCRTQELRACLDHFKERVRAFDRVRVRHIKRNQNLAGIALGQIRQGSRGRPSSGEEPMP